MPPAPQQFVADIRGCCEKVRQYTAGLTFEQFAADSRTFEAVLWNLAVIGEAAKQLPPDVRSQYPGVDWRNITRFRDIVIHHYFGVDRRIVWDITQQGVPELLAALGPAPSDRSSPS
jgi:uncharacterized protein with HEPN domain